MAFIRPMEFVAWLGAAVKLYELVNTCVKVAALAMQLNVPYVGLLPFWLIQWLYNRARTSL